MHRNSRRQNLSLPVSIFMLFLAATAITMVVIYLQPGAFRASLSGILHTPALVVLNYLPILLLCVLFASITGNVFAGAAITAVITELLSYANLLKIEGRNDPLVPGDVLLLRESLVAAGSYHLNMHPGCIALILGSILALILAACLFRDQRFQLRGLLRLLGITASTAALLISVSSVYADKDFYNALPDVDKSNVPMVFNTYGFPYCFLHNMNLYPVDRPKNYDAAAVARWEQEFLPAAQPLDVDVMLVMGEAFTDLSEEAVFAYPEGENPTAAYHEAADVSRAISGHMVASNTGAGTANTEFDVLTGMQTNMIGENTTSAFRVVRRNTDSLARVFVREGYSSWFMHPGQSWFYNRCNVFSYLGIDDQTFIDAFYPEDKNGSYVSDAALLGHIIEKDQSVHGSSFSYITTIENHQAYLLDKYTDPVTEDPHLTLELPGNVSGQFSVYFTGVRHTAEMIRDLADYLDTCERPTLLVFFGDHRPALGADYLCYRAISSDVGQEDTMEQILYTYETPYFIRANTAFCDKYDFQALRESLELPPENRISSSYLGSVIYELCGRTGSSAYWDYLIQARRALPVISHGVYMLADGTLTQSLSADQTAIVEKLHCWQYARIKNGVTD